MTPPLYVGIDMSKTRFDVAVCLAGEVTSLGQYANERAGCEALAAALAEYGQTMGQPEIQLVLEPTGGYEKLLVAYAFQQGWSVSRPNPKRVRDWAKGMGVRVKHDPMDSRVLARFGDACRPAAEAPLSPEVAQLESLLRRQEDLAHMLRQERNRRQALAYKPQAAPAAAASMDRFIHLLEQELAEIEAAMQALLVQHQDLKTEAHLLLTVAGVGRKTVLPLLVFLHRWQARTAGQGTAKGLVAFAGLDSQVQRSGDSVWGRPTISKMGCAATRRCLYLAAKGGVRAKNGPLRQFYDRLRGRGKAYDLVLVAAARKILVWSFAVFSHNVPFDPTRHNANPA